MTYKPPGPFDSLIKDLLGNVQRNADATMRRLETADERNFQRDMLGRQQDFTREQYQTQRTDQVADRDWARNNQLTDMAGELNRTSMQGLRNVMPFLINTPEFDDAQALVAALSEAHGLTGQQALDWVTNLTVTVGDRQVNLAGSLAKWQADADLRMRQEDMEAGWLETWMPMLADMSGQYSPDEKMAIARIIVQSQFMSNAVKDQALQLAGMDSAQNRADTIARGDILRAQADTAMAQADMTRIDADMYQAFKDGDLDAMNDASRARKEQLGQDDYAAFWETGYVPENEQARQSLMARLDMTEEQLAEQERVNQQRWVGVMESRARAEALGVDKQELDLAVANWSFDRTKAQADLTDEMAIATQVSAAAIAGDVPFLMMMKGLQDSGAYGDILGNLDLDAWIANARDVHETGEATRAATRAAATIERRIGVEEYISSIGSSFVLDNLEMGLDGEWIGLDALIEAELEGISAQDLRRFGVSEDDLRNKLKSWATRALNQNNLSEVQQRLAALESAIPPEGDTMRREAWRASYIDGMQLLGFSEAEADAIASRLLTNTDQADALWEAENTRIWQEVDLTYQQAVGQEIENMRNIEVLRMMLDGDGASMSIEQFQKLQSMYGEIAQRAQDMVNSGACGIPTSEAMWVAGTEVPQTFQAELPGCQTALNDANNARAMMNQLADEARFGPDGMVYLGNQNRSLEAAGAVGGAADHPYAAVGTITNLFTERGHSPESIALFNQDDYLSLPLALQRAIASDAQSGMSPEEINALMAEALFNEALLSGYTIPSSTAPTMLEAGIQVEQRQFGSFGPMQVGNIFATDEWRQLPIEQKVAQVSATREWEQLAASIANDAATKEGAPFPDEMSEERIMEIARNFGLFNSRQAEAGEAVDRTGAATTQVYDGDATREALNATIQELHRRGAAAIVQTAENQRALAQLDAEYQGLLAQRDAAGATGASGGSSVGSVGVTGRASATGGGAPGAGVVTPLGSSGDGSSGYSPQERIPGPVEDMELGPQGIANLKGHEGLRLEAYWDENGWAIGYGHRAGVKEGDTITPEQAEEFFRQDTQWVASAIKDNITVPLSQAQFDALASLVYNVGAGGWLAVAERINAGDMEGAEASWLSHNKARQGEDGPLVVLPGLTNRRRAEWAQFASGIAANHRPIPTPNARAEVPGARPVNAPDARAEVPEARPVNAPNATARLADMRTGGTMTSRRTGGRF